MKWSLALIVSFCVVSIQMHGYFHHLGESTAPLSEVCDFCLTASQTTTLENPSLQVDYIPPTLCDYSYIPVYSIAAFILHVSILARGPPSTAS